jgi:hypothetical protein
MAAMPSGREIYTLKAYVPPVLEPSVLEGMRAPPDRADDYGSDSSDEEREGENEPVGAFPGTKQDYGTESSRNYY